MITEKLKKTINEKIDIETLKTLIFQTSIVAWDNVITTKNIDRWLDNFDGSFLNDEEIEKKIAVWLLLNFTYYTEDDVKALCKELYRLFLNKQLKTRSFDEGMSRQEKIKDIQKSTKIVGLGNPSESGGKILFDFRTVNELSKSLFEIKEKEEYDSLIMIDDVTISGQQAIDYIKKNNISARYKYLLVFMATEKALKSIADEELDIEVIYSILLDERSQCFSDESYVFLGDIGEELKDVAYSLISFYGQKVVDAYDDEYMKDFPRGYDDNQQMIGFCYNTPNNTLPVFWCDKEWNAIFKRHNKIYEAGEVKIDDEEFL